jgi:5-enolpyruvylshikimate-3-phosphate synthase
MKILASDYVVKAPSDLSLKDEEIVIQHKGSKSICNRALVIASLLNTPITLHNISPGKDTTILISALSKLGIMIKQVGDDSVQVYG